MSIPFTQYLMPRGQKQSIDIDLSEDYPEAEAKAQEILSKGFIFECEMLSDYATVSFTITHPTLDNGAPFDLDCILAKNGPDVPSKVAELIMRFDPNKDYSLD